MITDEFRNLKFYHLPYSVQRLMLYIILNKKENEARIKIKINEVYKTLQMSEATLVEAIKELRKLKFIYKIGQSEFLINNKYLL